MKSKARFGGKLWFTALFFGLVGQIAWVVENMYFAASIVAVPAALPLIFLRRDDEKLRKNATR